MIVATGLFNTPTRPSWAEPLVTEEPPAAGPWVVDARDFTDESVAWVRDPLKAAKAGAFLQTLVCYPTAWEEAEEVHANRVHCCCCCMPLHMHAGCSVSCQWPLQSSHAPPTSGA